MVGAQGLTWFQIFNNILGDTNEGMVEFCLNTADTLLSDFFSQEGEENKEVDEG